MSLPAAETAPIISGNPRVGQTLITSGGTWFFGPVTSYEYQWQRNTTGVNNPLNFSNIAGATAQTYTLVSGDLGNYAIRVLVWAINADGRSVSPTASNPVTVLSAGIPFSSYTFASTTSATRAFRAYTFASPEQTLKNAQLLAATSAGASSDSGTLGTAFAVKLLDAVSAGASATTANLLVAAMPRHPVWIRTSQGWQILSPAVGYFTSATHAAGTTISLPRATHQLHATRGLMVTVHDETTGAQEVADVTVGANGDVGVSFTTSAAANSKRVTVIGPYT